MTIRLAELDVFLRDADGVGLAAAATKAPLRDRPAERRREAAARDAVLAAARKCRHARDGWYEEWVDGMRRDGMLTPIVRTGLSIEDVVRVLDALPAADEPIAAFAERVLHDTKALAGGALRGLVLRALTAWQGVPAPAQYRAGAGAVGDGRRRP